MAVYVVDPNSPVTNEPVKYYTTDHIAQITDFDLYSLKSGYLYAICFPFFY